MLIGDETRDAGRILPPRYRMERELGHGGMAVVYLCEDTDHGNRVAVKVLRSDYANAITGERFVREVEFVSKLNHPRIPKIIDTGVTSEQPYYVMTYIEGDSLRKKLERTPKLPVGEAVDIACRILEPLGYAHEHGIVHRDIKPDNVILAPDGVYVLDFGIARAISDAGGERLTRTGLTVGTPAYISPEQAVGDHSVDHRADIFSLGCVLYEMLAGVQPFKGHSPQALIAQRFTSPPVPLRELRDDVPEALAAAITAAMRIPARDRWSTSAEFKQALEESVSKSPAQSQKSNQLLTRLREMFSGQYSVDEEMKGGGMSRLFLATDLELRRKVVIKILPPDMTSPMMLARFKRESEVTARLQHPHILPVISAGIRDGLAYYVMPFFEGESLRARMKREGKLPIADSVRILCEITDALDCAHEKGVVHRDIKPENILILGGHGVLADFGIAAALSASDTENGERITGTGMSLGTVGYMAPEQALGEKKLDARADIYSVGVVGYEMFAGSPPFTGDTDQAILVGHLTREPEPLEKIRPDAPVGVREAIKKALQKDPASRFQSAADFHAAIDGTKPVASTDLPVLSGAGSNRLQVEAGSAVIPSIPRGQWGRWWKIAVPIASLAVIAALAYINSRDVDAPNGPQLDKANVAVLYFRDLSPRHELGHLTDAFTEELIDKLQEVNALHVTSKNGVQEVRKMQIAPDSAAKILKAGTLVDGSVEQIGDRVRVKVMLLDGSTADEINRASFEYPAGDPLGMRERLVRDVSDFLRQRIGEQAQLSQWKAGTSDPQAWLLVQRGEKLLKESDALSSAGDTAGAARQLLSADSFFAMSAARDAKWMEPVVMRGTAAFKRSRIASEPPEMSEWADKGLKYVEQALAIDSRNAAALELRGTLHYWRWLNDLATTSSDAAQALAKAETDLRAALRIAPHRASAWSVLSSLSSNKADPIEAAMAARRAYEEDAYLSAAPDIVWRLYSSAYDNQQAIQARQWCTEGAQRFPSNPRFVQCRLWLLTMPGVRTSVDSAWRLVGDLHKVTPDKEWPFSGREAQMLVAAGLARAGLADSARRVLTRARGDATADPSRDLLIDEALVRVILGDKDEALRLLKLYLVANPEHRAGMAETQSWWWQDLKGDPRYQQMVGAGSR